MDCPHCVPTARATRRLSLFRGLLVAGGALVPWLHGCSHERGPVAPAATTTTTTTTTSPARTSTAVDVASVVGPSPLHPAPAHGPLVPRWNALAHAPAAPIENLAPAVELREPGINALARLLAFEGALLPVTERGAVRDPPEDHAIDAATGAALPPLGPGPIERLGTDPPLALRVWGNAIVGQDVRTGAERFRTRLHPDGMTMEVRAWALTDGVLTAATLGYARDYVPNDQEAGLVPEIVAVDIADGRILWRAPGDVRVAAATAGVVATLDQVTRTLVGRQARTGRELWRAPSPAGYDLGLTADSGRLLATGPVGPDMQRVDALQVFDATTGRRIAPAAPITSVRADVLAVRHGVAYVAEVPAGPQSDWDHRVDLVARAVADGAERWRVPGLETAAGLIGRALGIAADDEAVFVVEYGGTVRALERTTGRERWRYTIPGYCDQIALAAPSRGAPSALFAIERNASSLLGYARAARPQPAQRVTVEGEVELRETVAHERPNRGVHREPPDLEQFAWPGGGYLLSIDGAAVRADAHGRFRATVEARGAVLVWAGERSIRDAAGVTTSLSHASLLESVALANTSRLARLTLSVPVVRSCPPGDAACEAALARTRDATRVVEPARARDAGAPRRSR